MLEMQVVSREDLSRVIERVSLDLPPDATIADIMLRECPAYTQEAAEKAYLTLVKDGVKIPAALWGKCRVGNARYITVIIEAGGLTAMTIMAIVSVVMAVASAIYSIISMNKLGKAGQAETKQGSSIYDVNAQGNQVNLTNVIPETFGHFKRFPDYLADKHIFYRNHIMFVDMILCQGRGQYERAGDGSDVFVGETPISELPGCQVSVLEPGETMTDQNTPEDKSWYCYYQCTEVTGSGHTLEPAVTEINQSSQMGSQITYAGATLSGGYYTSQIISGGTQGPGSATIYKTFSLPWDEGSYLTIEGSVDIRDLGTSDAMTPDAVTGTTSIIAELPAYFLGTGSAQHRAWLRPRETDPEDPTVIISAGDLVNVTTENVTRLTYTIRGGTGGVEIRTAENVDSITAQAELLAIAYNTLAGTATMTFDSLEMPSGSYPAAPSAPAGAYNTSITYERRITLAQPMPADYSAGSDNGLYEYVSHDGNVYTLQKVTSSYAPVTGWSEFWAQGYTQTGLTFRLDESSSTAGQFVGPYRACPVGATATIFEYDIRFPSGLGYLQDNGTFRDLTVTLEIGYRRAGSNEAWTTVQREFTDHTNDELAYTYQIEVATPDNYEFRIKNLTESSNSTRALEEVRWVGLKSVISTKNKYDDVTVMICRFRGSETLSELSENQIATYWTRKLPPVGGGAAVATRDLAPAVQYIVNQSKYAGILDATSLADFDSYWTARSIELNGTIDSDGTLLQVLQDVLTVGFSSPIIRDNKLAFSRLHPQGDNEPLAQIFTMQNLTASPEITFNLPKEDDVDEVVVEYTSPETYKTETIFCHVDENGDKSITLYPESAHQEKLRAFGVTSREQAEAMGMRRLRYLRNTRVTYKIKTELDGLNCQYNDLVGLVLDENLSNITGRVLAYDSESFTITTDQQIPLTYSAGIVYIRKLDGTPITRTFTRVDSHHLQLSDAMFTWNARYGADLEYPFFAIGELVRCWVTGVTPTDKTCELTLINYADDIFTDDLTASEGYGINPYGISPYGK